MITELKRPTSQTPIITQLPSIEQIDNDSLRGVLEITTRPGILFLIIAIIALTLSSGLQPKRTILAHAYWAGKKEKKALRDTALKQIEERQLNKAAIWIGKPKDKTHKKNKFVANLNRGCMVAGTNGVGKTVFVIDPAVQSILMQGLSAVIYDRKYPVQTARIVALAEHLGYKVHIFAPGHKESSIFNFLKYVPNSYPAIKDLASVLYTNFRVSSQADQGGAKDPFWDTASKNYLAALLYFARNTKYPDFLTTRELAKINDVVNIVKKSREDLPDGIWNAFLQAIQASDSEKTLASIASGTSDTLTGLINDTTVPYLCGESGIPTDLTGKTLIICGYNAEEGDALMPLVACAIHLIIERAMRRQRTEPLFLVLDEAASLYLDKIEKWLSQNRENGLCTIMGFQNIGQLEKTYGQALARVIVGQLNNKILFNPGEEITAERFSKLLGKTEITYPSKSRSTTSGKITRQVSEQRTTIDLWSVDQWMCMGTGAAVMKLAGCENKKTRQDLIPFLEYLEIDPDYIQLRDHSVSLWPKFRSAMIARNTIVDFSDRDRIRRQEEIEERLPAIARAKANARAQEALKQMKQPGSDSLWG